MESVNPARREQKIDMFSRGEGTEKRVPSRGWVLIAIFKWVANFLVGAHQTITLAELLECTLGMYVCSRDGIASPENWTATSGLSGGVAWGTSEATVH